MHALGVPWVCLGCALGVPLQTEAGGDGAGGPSDGAAPGAPVAAPVPAPAVPGTGCDQKSDEEKRELFRWTEERMLGCALVRQGPPSPARERPCTAVD